MTTETDRRARLEAMVSGANTIKWIGIVGSLVMSFVLAYMIASIIPGASTKFTAEDTRVVGNIMYTSKAAGTTTRSWIYDYVGTDFFELVFWDIQYQHSVRILNCRDVDKITFAEITATGTEVAANRNCEEGFDIPFWPDKTPFLGINGEYRDTRAPIAILKWGIKRDYEVAIKSEG